MKKEQNSYRETLGVHNGGWSFNACNTVVIHFKIRENQSAVKVYVSISSSGGQPVKKSC